jgi:hypothetical protein
LSKFQFCFVSGVSPEELWSSAVIVSVKSLKWLQLCMCCLAMQTGRTALYMAAQHGQLESLKELLAKGAAMDHPNQVKCEGGGAPAVDQQAQRKEPAFTLLPCFPA